MLNAIFDVRSKISKFNNIVNECQIVNNLAPAAHGSTSRTIVSTVGLPLWLDANPLGLWRSIRYDDTSQRRDYRRQ